MRAETSIELATESPFRDPAVRERLVGEEQARWEHHPAPFGQRLSFGRREIHDPHLDRVVVAEPLEERVGALAQFATILGDQRDLHSSSSGCRRRHGSLVKVGEEVGWR